MHKLFILPKTNYGEIMEKKAALIGTLQFVKERYIEIIQKKYNLVTFYYQEINYEYLKIVDVIFLDSDIPYSLIVDLYHFGLNNNKEVNIFPNLILLSNYTQEKINDVLILKLKQYQLTFFQRIVKRTFDFIFSLIAILLLSPLMLVIYLVLKIFDPGPAFYLQKRLTKNQRPFTLFKFRTMINQAEDSTGVILSPMEDERITKIGKFLRRTRFDELPQFFNVLIGDMSIVGPRPEREYFVNKFIFENKSYNYRFNVKAGITGLSQINCRYSSQYDEKLHFDLYYISHYRMELDLKIIIKTVKVFFDKRSSLGVEHDYQINSIKELE